MCSMGSPEAILGFQVKCQYAEEDGNEREYIAEQQVGNPSIFSFSRPREKQEYSMMFVRWKHGVGKGEPRGMEDEAVL